MVLYYDVVRRAWRMKFTSTFIRADSRATRAIAHSLEKCCLKWNQGYRLTWEVPEVDHRKFSLCLAKKLTQAVSIISELTLTQRSFMFTKQRKLLGNIIRDANFWITSILLSQCIRAVLNKLQRGRLAQGRGLRS